MIKNNKTKKPLISGIYNTKKKSYKNRSQFKNSQDKQYRISVVQYPSWVKNKDDKTTIIKEVQGGYKGHQWKKVNLKQELKNQNNWKKVMSGHLMNLGYLTGKTYPKINSKMLDIKADFVFFDFDNKDKNGKITKGYLSYDDALSILKKSDLNYVLSTSHSHTNNHHKLHILIPTLKPIDSDGLYKHYFYKLAKLFNGYKIDRSVNNISRSKHGGNLKTIKVDVEFNKNDFHLKNVNLATQKALKKVSNTKVSKKICDIPLNDLSAYGNQVNKMYGMLVDTNLSTTNSIRLRRDLSDNNAGVFCVPYSDDYNPKLIVDNKTGKDGKKKKFDTMFSLNDYVVRKNPNKIRQKLLNRMSQSIEDWFCYTNKNGFKHNYLITNEGLGKSTSVLSLGQKYLYFIYACYTKENVDEKAQILKQKGIPFRIILSVETILRNEGFEYLIDDYNSYYNTTREPTFKKFLKQSRKVCAWEIGKLLNIYRKNNEQIHYAAVILMTTAKLKIMMEYNQAKIMSDWKPVIIDEFVESEWKEFSSENKQKLYKPSLIVKSTWENERGSFNLYKQKSMFELLTKKNVLVLTTERTLAELCFYGSDYSEMSVCFEQSGKYDDKFKWVPLKNPFFDRKLRANNVHYLLVKSTSKRNDTLVNQIKFFEEYDVVIISDGAKTFNEKVLSHLATKGRNNLSNKNMVVFATFKPEIVIKEIYHNNKKYFKNWFLNNKKELQKKYGKKLSGKKLIEKYIQKILIETQVSQSIGRNSGFRYNGNKCIVVIPVRYSNSTRRLDTNRNFDFNYISENVSVVDFNPQKNQFKKVSNF